ncbi:hypothetical protein MPSEU_000566400 [Mayamaea pseudoterrestris]|nr:hypothetical protein MPSEU_000566400 [Mayamaea pseudoterrestris]
MSTSHQSSNSSQLLGDQRSEPVAAPATSLNDRLQAQHTDVPEDDDSIQANLVRSICQAVAYVLTPRQVLGIIRVLKAITFCFLVLNLLSNTMYIIFVHMASPESVKTMAGGWRDTVIRVYGLGLCMLALAVEIDVSRLVKKFSGLKGFIARALFMFLIAAITSSHPIYDKTLYEKQSQYYADDAAAGDDANGDDGAANGDDANGGDDAYSSGYVAVADPSSEIPSSAVNFQMVTAFVLSICALGYLVCGLLCFDRFTTRAFLATKDPRVTTSIA